MERSNSHELDHQLDAGERVVGVSLDEVLHHVRTDGPPPIAVAVSLVTELAEALAHAHERGVVHGDIRPCHLIIDNAGNLRLLGFGVAGLAEIPGHSCYVAPEILAGAPPDARADLYSLGVVAYELITGHPLFDEHTAPELRRYLAARIRLPSTCNSDCPRELDELLVGALATDPTERWATASELREAIAVIGGPAPALVRDWLAQAIPYAPQLPTRAFPPPIPASAPPRPRRMARGTGRLPSPSPVGSDESIHEAETVIREITPPPERELRLPLVPPSGAYEALDVADENWERAPDSARSNDAPSLPAIGASSWTEPEQVLLPMPESRALTRCLDIGLAFAAGAATMYLLLTWLG